MPRTHKSADELCYLQHSYKEKCLIHRVTVNVVTYVHSIVDVTTVQIIYMPVVIFTKTICTQCHHDHKHYDIAQKDNV